MANPEAIQEFGSLNLNLVRERWFDLTW